MQLQLSVAGGRRPWLGPAGICLSSEHRLSCLAPPTHHQVAALWDELHTKQPWRNAVGGNHPVNPFPADGQEDRDAPPGPHLVLYIGVNSASVLCCARCARCDVPRRAAAALPECRALPQTRG